MKIIKRLAVGESLTVEEWRQLETAALQPPRCPEAFGIDQATVESVIRQRSRLLQKVYPAFEQFCQRFQTAPLNTLWHLWLPLALRLAQQRQALNRPLIHGILGGQGTGKTTLGAMMTLILQQLGHSALSLSLDDLYKTYADRQRLQAQDPRLIWRGPPGTHDIDLGVQVLDRLRQPTPGGTIAIPRFDKSLHGGSGDRITPELVSTVDIVLFEGWFVGLHPIDPARFDHAPIPITTLADRAFARDMNAKLHDYLPLWQRLDQLIILNPVDYRFSKQWRQQAEQAMKAGGRSGMNDVEIDRFVDYFWKALHPELFIKPLMARSRQNGLVIEIQQDHTVGTVYLMKRHAAKTEGSTAQPLEMRLDAESEP